MAACSPPGAKGFDAMSGEEHLACAVDISAYTYLLAAGKVPEDPEMASKAERSRSGGTTMPMPSREVSVSNTRPSTASAPN